MTRQPTTAGMTPALEERYLGSGVDRIVELYAKLAEINALVEESQQIKDEIETILQNSSNTVFAIGDNEDGISFDIVAADRAIISDDDTLPWPSMELEIETGTTTSLLKKSAALDLRDDLFVTRDKARQWAEEDEDVEVESGEFSSRHWAIKGKAEVEVAVETALSKAEAWADNPEDIEVEAGQFSGRHWSAKAEGFKEGAKTAEAGSIAARLQAEAARDAAFVNADVYASIATGRAAVADGEQFMVVDGNEVVRYRRDSSSTQTEVARYYSSEGVDDWQRQFSGLFLVDPYYEIDGDYLYIKPGTYSGNAAYIRGGFLANDEFTYTQIKSDLGAMAAPTNCELGATSPAGVTDCIKLYAVNTIYFDPATATWGWAARAAGRTGMVKVIENDAGGQIGPCTEYAEIVRKLAATEITKTRTEHLTPIIAATGYPPNIDTAANTLTFTIDTLVMHRNTAYRVDATTAIDLTAVASSTKVLYMDLRDKSFVLRAYNSAFTEVEKQFFVLLAVIRYSAPNVHAAISCQYTVDGRSPWSGLDARQVEWAAVFTPFAGAPTPTTNLPNYDTATDTLTFYPDTIFVSGNNRWVASSGASVSLSGSSANRIFWDTATSSLVFKAWNTDLTRAEAAKYVLVAAIRDASASFLPPVISMMCPYTVDGKLFGYIPEYATSGAENRAGAALEGIMHRGYSSVAPENTLAAYKAAAAARRYVVEGDIQWTSDGVAVLLHDDTIDRTSDGTGTIVGMSLATAKTYDFGSWKGSAFAGEEIPTWDEFLILAKKLDLHGYFEIKTDATLAQVQGLLASVAKAGMKQRVQFDSFHLLALQKIVSEDATQDVGYLVGALDDATWTTAVANAAALLGGGNRVAIEPPMANLTKARVEEAHQAGLRVVVYTINSASDVYTLADMGVDGIMTDALNIAQVIRDNEL